MNESEQSKTIPGTEQRERQRSRIYISLEQAVKQLSLKEVVLELSDICLQQHQESPYFNWDKDAQLIAFLASYIEN